MKIIFKGRDCYLLRFDKGENYPFSLINFLEKEKVKNAFFYGLGGFLEAEIAYYDLEKKKYLSKKFKGPFEVASLIGNVAFKEKELIVHNHVVLGYRNFNTISGHLLNAKIGGTLEIYLVKIKGKKIKRVFDKETGLYLLNNE